MGETLRIERDFAASIDRVFDHLTRPGLLAQWWGPEGIVGVKGQLDFTQPGPYDSTMLNAQGGRHRVSGQVTRVERPTLVAFTWAWHDEAGHRGHESHVMFELQETEDGGTRFVLTHQQLETVESRDNHGQGWTSSLRRLVALLDG